VGKFIGEHGDFRPKMNDKLWDIMSFLRISGKLEKRSHIDLIVDEDFNFVMFTWA